MKRCIWVTLCLVLIFGNIPAVAQSYSLNTTVDGHAINGWAIWEYPKLRLEFNTNALRGKEVVFRIFVHVDDGYNQNGDVINLIASLHRVFPLGEAVAWSWETMISPELGCDFQIDAQYALRPEGGRTDEETRTEVSAKGIIPGCGPTSTPTPSVTLCASETPTDTPTETATLTPSTTLGASSTPTETPESTTTPTATSTATFTVMPTATPEGTAAVPTATPTGTVEKSATPTCSATIRSSETLTPTPTVILEGTATPTTTPAASATPIPPPMATKVSPPIATPTPLLLPVTGGDFQQNLLPMTPVIIIIIIILAITVIFGSLIRAKRQNRK